MNRTLSTALLLTLALSGCKNIPPTQAPQADTRSAGNNGDYDRTYQTESRHHHRHGRREGDANDSWTGYDRPDSNDEAASRPNARTYPGDSSNDASSQGRSRGHHNSRAMTSAPGQFDFYVLNLSWSPEFCHSHPSAAECAQHRAFTLHGLWPQNTNGTYPEDCSDAPGPASPSQYADIYPDASLLQHEWQTHGTCSGLQPDGFLGLARRAEQSIQIPSALAHPTGQTALAPAQIVTLFTQANPSLPAGSVAISCGNNYLTAVEVCMDKNLRPESCQAVKTCGANQVRISAP